MTCSPCPCKFIKKMSKRKRVGKVEKKGKFRKSLERKNLRKTFIPKVKELVESGIVEPYRPFSRKFGRAA